MLLRATSLAAGIRCFSCRTAGEWLCRSCSAELGPPKSFGSIAGVDRATIPWAYEGAARDLILALKLRAKRPAAAVLGEAAAREIQRYGTRSSSITWVPGRRSDVRLRGFDHAELIARELGSRIGLPV